MISTQQMTNILLVRISLLYMRLSDRVIMVL